MHPIDPSSANLDTTISGRTSMFYRMALIRSATGNGPFIRTLIFLFASMGLPIAEWFIFGACYGGPVVIVLTILGWMLRSIIRRLGDYFQVVMMIVLVAYGGLLLMFKTQGYSNHAQLVLITAATAIVFNLNYWYISETVIYRRGLDRRE